MVEIFGLSLLLNSERHDIGQIIIVRGWFWPVRRAISRLRFEDLDPELQGFIVPLYVPDEVMP